MISENDDKTTDKWICPHCKNEMSCNIVQDQVVRDDFREILCECMRCENMFIRQYKYVKSIKLVRKEK